MGVKVGEVDCDSVGANVGEADGDSVGAVVAVGDSVGAVVGEADGLLKYKSCHPSRSRCCKSLYLVEQYGECAAAYSIVLLAE